MGSQPMLHHDLVGRARRGQFELIRGVDLRVELDRLDGRSLEAKGLQPVSALSPHSLNLEGPADAVRVVLEHDDPLKSRRVGVDQHDPALDYLGRTRKRTHGSSSSLTGAPSPW